MFLMFGFGTFFFSSVEDFFSFPNIRPVGIEYQKWAASNVSPYSVVCSQRRSFCFVLVPKILAGGNRVRRGCSMGCVIFYVCAVFFRGGWVEYRAHVCILGSLC